VNFAGVLIIDKPTGMTSHTLVAHVRRRLSTRRVGHAGTLDPDATGVLVVCVGDATRLLEYMVADEKSYEGVITFGSATTTDDASGAVVSTGDASSLSLATIQQGAFHLTGDILQQVPQYSAVHIDGERAYDLARRGVAFDAPRKRVQVNQFELSDLQVDGQVAHAKFSVECSKGTYIRALCRDLGQHVGVPAHMDSLRRTKSGSYSLAESLTLAEWEALDAPEMALRPLREAVRQLSDCQVEERDLLRISQGQRVAAPPGFNARCAENRDIALMYGSQVVAICRLSEDELGVWLKPRKVLWKKDE